MNDSMLLWESDRPLSERLKITRNQPFDPIPAQLLRKVGLYIYILNNIALFNFSQF